MSSTLSYLDFLFCVELWLEVKTSVVSLVEVLPCNIVRLTCKGQSQKVPGHIWHCNEIIVNINTIMIGTSLENK